MVLSFYGNVKKEKKSNMRHILRHFLEHKVTIQLPEELTPMSPKDINATYPMVTRRPKEVYCTTDQRITFSINHTIDKLQLIQLPAYQKLVFERQFTHPNIQLLTNNIQPINQTDFIIMEYVLPIGQQNLYNLLFVTALQGNMLIGTFNCPESLSHKWNTIFKQSLASIKLNT